MHELYQMNDWLQGEPTVSNNDPTYFKFNTNLTNIKISIIAGRRSSFAG